MQSLDVQLSKPELAPLLPGAANKTGAKTAMNGKTGAETARNGSSFLAMIEKMIAGTMDGKTDALKASSYKTAGRGAGDTSGVPGDGNILIKPGSGKGSKPASNEKNGPETVLATQGQKKPHEDKGKFSLSEKTEGVSQSIFAASVPKGNHVRTDADVSTDAILKETKPSGPKIKKNGNGSSETDVSFVLAGMHNGAVGQKKGMETAGNVVFEDSTGKKTEKTDRKDKKTIISVRDERLANGSIPTDNSPLSKSVTVNKDGTADMSIGFRNAQSGSGVPVNTESRFMEQNDGKQGQSFSSMLSSELRSNAADFVKTGSIVLRENNSGLIRLTLHPESLGNVKISLELSDKKISGKIIVSSKEAYDAFNENLDGLSDAFVAGGFESAGFDLSWTGQESAGEAQQEAQGKISSPFYASSIPGVMSDGNTADTIISGWNTKESGINVFA